MLCHALQARDRNESKLECPTGLEPLVSRFAAIDLRDEASYAETFRSLSTPQREALSNPYLRILACDVDEMPAPLSHQQRARQSRGHGCGGPAQPLRRFQGHVARSAGGGCPERAAAVRHAGHEEVGSGCKTSERCANCCRWISSFMPMRERPSKACWSKCDMAGLKTGSAFPCAQCRARSMKARLLDRLRGVAAVVANGCRAETAKAIPIGPAMAVPPAAVAGVPATANRWRARRRVRASVLPEMADEIAAGIAAIPADLRVYVLTDSDEKRAAIAAAVRAAGLGGRTLFAPGAKSRLGYRAVSSRLRRCDPAASVGLKLHGKRSTHQPAHLRRWGGAATCCRNWSAMATGHELASKVLSADRRLGVNHRAALAWHRPAASSCSVPTMRRSRRCWRAAGMSISRPTANRFPKRFDVLVSARGCRAAARSRPDMGRFRRIQGFVDADPQTRDASSRMGWSEASWCSVPAPACAGRRCRAADGGRRSWLASRRPGCAEAVIAPNRGAALSKYRTMKPTMRNGGLSAAVPLHRSPERWDQFMIFDSAVSNFSVATKVELARLRPVGENTAFAPFRSVS